MKFSKLSQLFLVSSIGLLVATLLTACSITTIDYVFVANAGSLAGSDGSIQTFAADSQSGALRTAGASVSTGGVNPVAMAVSSDYTNLYVANKTSGTVVHFSISSNGVLTAKDSVSVSSPVALAVNTAGTYLYVVSGSTSATLTEYPLSSGTIGTTATFTQQLSLTSVSSSYANDVLVPTGIAVLANNSTVSGNAVYVTLYDQTAYTPGCSTCATSSANPGWVFGYTIAGGVLTAATNSPYQAGVEPSGIASDPTDRFVYVTDYASNQLIGYSILDGSTLQFLTSGPFSTGSEPSAVVVDPRGEFIYVSNALSSTVSAYAITQSTGVPSSSVSAATNTTDTQPVAIAVDPALGRFVYTANYLGDSVSGFRLNPTSGVLSATQATPYPTGTGPTAIVVVPHGNHAIQVVNP